MSAGFYDALKVASTPVAFVMALADLPLVDEIPGIDEQELIDQREAMITKAREFQAPLDIWLPEFLDALKAARKALLGAAGQRGATVEKLERLLGVLES